MQNRAEEMRRWWAAIEPLRKLSYLKIKSIDDFLEDLGKTAGTTEGNKRHQKKGEGREEIEKTKERKVGR
jgi:hypothetical protein